MRFDYNQIVSTDAEEFAKIKASLDLADYTKSDAADICRIEAFLDLRPGVLAGHDLYIETCRCGCGRSITFYDFVFTSVVDAEHSKSFIVHTLFGSKLIVNKPRLVRCSACNDNVGMLGYSEMNYVCWVQGVD